MTRYRSCVQFEKETLIGQSKESGAKSFIEIEISPCVSNCYVHTFDAPFPVPGPHEINPNNPVPAYEVFMHPFFLANFFLVQYINTVTDYENYDKPISQAMGIPEEFIFNLQTDFTAKMNFE